MPSSELSIKLELGEPPPEIMAIAGKLCNEDPETRLMVLSELREMIYERGECTPHRMDDAFLLRFLRARMFVPERAHRLLVNYCNFKEEHPEIHERVDLWAMDFIGRHDVLTVPPYRDQDGRRAMVYRIGAWDTNAYSIDEIFKATVIVQELGILEQRAQILGGIALFDLDNIGMNHAWQITPTVAAKIVKLMVTASYMKIHKVHIVNHSWIFDKVFSMFKPLLNKTMSERIFFHGYDMTSLHKHWHPDFLSVKYGGNRPELPHTLWTNSLRTDKEALKEMESLGYVLDLERFKDMPNEVPSSTSSSVEISQ